MPEPSFLRSPRQTPWRNWIFQLHLWVGLTLGLLVGVVGLTGAIVVFRYELNRVTTPGTAYVRPQAQRLSVDELTACVQAHSPANRILQAAWEAGPDTAWNFRTFSPEGHRVHIFVDPYTAAVTGQDDYQNKFMQWMFDLHADLLAGDTGRTINGFIAVATILQALAGLVVWWPGLSHWRFGFRYLGGARWQRQNYDLHKLLGFYTSLALAFVAFTGAYFAFPLLYKQAAATITGTRVLTDGPSAKTAWTSRGIPIEEYIRAAEQAQPGAHAISLSYPQKPGDPVSVRLKETYDWHRIGLNYVYLEPADAGVISSVRFESSTWGTKLILWMYPFHFGRFGGRFGPAMLRVVMVVYVLIGVAPFALMITGFAMYWNRSLSKKFSRRRLRTAESETPVSVSR